MKNQITKHHKIFNGCMQLMEIEWQKEVGILELKHGGEMIEEGKRLTFVTAKLEELTAEVERLKMENFNLKEALKASQNN